MTVVDQERQGANQADREPPTDPARWIADHDWAATPLGPMVHWPAALRSLVDMMLRSPTPMVLLWGEDGIMLYNRPYAEFAGGRHPHLLGNKVREGWPEVADFNDHVMRTVLAGHVLSYRDQELTLHRNGRPEQVWMNLDYSPIVDDAGRPVGVICILGETTEGIAADRKRRQVEEQVRASEERFRLMADAVPQIVWITDAEGRAEFFNRQWSNYTGEPYRPTTAAEIAADHVHPDDRAETMTAFDAARASGGTFLVEHRIRSARGEYRWFLVRGEPYRDPLTGRIVRWFGASVDIHDRRMAEASLQESEALLRRFNDSLERLVDERTAERDRMWEASPDLLLVIDFDGVFRRVNPAWTTLLGYTADELVGHHANEFVIEEDHRATIDAYQATAAGRPAQVENSIRHKDGSLRRISWVGVPAGEMTYASGRDITAERAMAAKLRDEQDFARLALSAVGGVGVWTYDMAADRYVCDAAIVALYALDPAQVGQAITREQFFANVHPDDRAALAQILAEGRVRAGELEIEYRLVHPDGSIRWVLSRGHTYVDAEGRPVRRTGIGVDLTSQRQVEEQLRQSQKMEALGQLTGGIAHDFNNLLTVIRGSAELLRRPDLSSERRERYAKAIADTADRATKLTHQLLSFARRQALTPEVFDVAASVRGIGDMLATLTGSRIAIDLDLGDCPCHVNADRTQFDTAIVNMTVNARDAMEGEGRLSIAVRAADHIPAVRAHPMIPGAFVAVTLTDTGPGIAADRLDQIFEPFFTTKDVGHGTGLGLSQVFGFAKQSGGEVVAGNAPAGGAQITLYLPLVETAATPRDARGDPTAPIPSGDDLYVLVVEDNLEVGEFAIQALAELGYRTRWVVSGREALAELAAGEAVDLVFTDVVMPGMSGIELGREIARLYPGLPVVLTSGYSDAIVHSGASGFPLLQKPYSIGGLARILQQGIRSSA
ncbi:PAS domain-containing hybrid sensor histidine kinase/response regulator [Sphingomonas abaci]|uniref:histidine kinase n=1 Tax=Sphingomonas abaci TaxID=237611 RepID=A0A7W7AH87_9SPHN|nr:hybrid sensor histidine kinase/response regulator [Sphingomonas abaci]MBB4616989.1 PAS domain S-box-containing protein [Sphingomonas abaci]